MCFNESNIFYVFNKRLMNMFYFQRMTCKGKDEAHTHSYFILFLSIIEFELVCVLLDSFRNMIITTYIFGENKTVCSPISETSRTYG